MARTLQDRQQAALKPGARLADIRLVHAETEAAIEAAGADVERHRRAALNPLANDDEARASRTAQTDGEYRIERLTAALAMLADVIAKRELDDEALTRAKNYDAASKSRQELVNRIADELPGIIVAYMALVDAIDENDGMIGYVNRDLPRAERGLKQPRPRVEAFHRPLPRCATAPSADCVTLICLWPDCPMTAWRQWHSLARRCRRAQCSTRLNLPKWKPPQKGGATTLWAAGRPLDHARRDPVERFPLPCRAPFGSAAKGGGRVSSSSRPPSEVPSWLIAPAPGNSRKASRAIPLALHRVRVTASLSPPRR